MPASRTAVRAVKLAVAIAGVALLISLFGAVQNALYAHRNCHSIEYVKAIQYVPLKRSYQKVLAGENDDDYLRIYGAAPVKFEGKLIPRWQLKKREALNVARIQLAQLEPRHCSYIIWRNL